MSGMTDTEDEGPDCMESITWTAKNENAFFQSAAESKPKGPGKHWHMATICDNFYSLTGQWVSPKVLWDHLGTMYNLEALEDAESSLCFSEDDYTLPEEELELTDLIDDRSREIIQDEKLITPKVIKDYSRKKEAIKKEDAEVASVEKSPEKKSESMDESDEDDTPLKPSKEMKKGKQEDKPLKSSAKKVPAQSKTATPKRSTRNTKEKVDESSPALASANKAEDEATSGSTKKEKVTVGKRSLRSREDESSAKSSSPAPTPPPTKRARRV